jgi:hypothetical protein
MKKICQTCCSHRLASIIAKTGEYCVIEISNKRQLGPVPREMNIGGDEYLEFRYLSGLWSGAGAIPVPPIALEAIRLKVVPSVLKLPKCVGK